MSKNTTKSTFMPTLLLVLVGMIWGSGFVASRLSLNANCSPAFVLLGRFLIASLTFAIIFRKSIFPLTKEQLKYGFIVGVFLFLAFYTQIVGMQYTNPANSGFLTATNVIMVPLITWFWLKKRPGGLVFISCLFCMLGIGVLNYNAELGISFNVGDIWTLICAFFFACHIAFVSIFSEKMDPVRFTFLQFFWATLFSSIVFGLSGWQTLGTMNWALGLPAVFYLGLIITCLCFFIQTYAQTKVPSSQAAVILSTEGFWCMVFSVIVGFEPLTVNIVVGGAIILFSVILSESKLSFGKRKEIQEGAS